MDILLILSLILLAAGLGGILFMAARKMPTLVKLPPSVKNIQKESLWQRFLLRLRGIKYSAWRPLILNWLEKSLRKARLLILKTDNLFTNWINLARQRSETWTVRSRAWVEHHRLKSKEKGQVLEKLDKMEISQTLEKMDKEAAVEEDQAFKEKIRQSNGSSKNFSFVKDDMVLESSSVGEPQINIQATVLPEEPEEKIYIDLISKNPKDVEAYRALGFIYLRQKNYSDARACFRQVLKLKPEDEGVKNKLNEIKGLQKNKKSADGVL